MPARKTRVGGNPNGEDREGFGTPKQFLQLLTFKTTNNLFQNAAALFIDSQNRPRLRAIEVPSIDRTFDRSNHIRSIEPADFNRSRYLRSIEPVWTSSSSIFPSILAELRVGPPRLFIVGSDQFVNYHDQTL